MISRRRFLGQLSAASTCAFGQNVYAGPIRSPLADFFETSTLPGLSFDRWRIFGRAIIQRRPASIIIQDGFIVARDAQHDCEFSFRARAPKDVGQVQIWAGIRCRDRDSRYVFGLRGGDNDDVYLARYAPNGAAVFLGIAPLGFHPEPDSWYSLRAVAHSNRLQIYINDESIPRINVEDSNALWTEGAISLGGGWLPVEFEDVRVRALTIVDMAILSNIGESTWQLGKVDKSELRAEQRSAYQPCRIPSLLKPRTEASLDGDWLFLPEQELPPGALAQSEDLDDSGWHIMDVPNFWTPTLSWLHGETGFPNLKGVSAGKGISDKLHEEELRRLDGYTFDWQQTRSAWYRQHIELPSQIEGQRFELCFDAIAKISEVWVNGTSVGSHVGMFGEVTCDITHAIHPGPNVIAVHVLGRLKQEASNRVMGVAVTVEVTSSMLNSLPHGMYRDEASGIWQPVKLVVTRETFLKDIVTKPRLDGLDFEVIIQNSSLAARTCALSYTIHSLEDGSSLYAPGSGVTQTVAPGSETIALSTPPITPKLWSPQEPNLYSLEITLISDGEVFDRRTLSFGFRTFAVDKEKLLLNGKPFWLRGANHFPSPLRPNDKKLARRFIQLAKEGNVLVTRSHTAPFTKTWLDAADELGLAVSYEGTWPWLMLEGEPPSEELLRTWKNEFLALIRKYRNHPSIIFWTVNNEMKFPVFDKNKPALLNRKWEILSDMVQSIRQTDATRPLVCDSSYTRREVGDEYEETIRAKGFDDGDIDDSHRYFGWYDPSFFHFFKGQFGKSQSYPGRPLISQEMSTGYPRNDDGHPTRFYLFKHYTPQSLVGSEAYENRDPAVFLKRQAFMTKELAETIRRTNRAECSGILHFAYVSWFKDAWNAATIRPFETYYALKTALQPVLISAELYGRHFYAGSTTRVKVYLVNDADDRLPLAQGELLWRISSGRDGQTIARGSSTLPATPYYSNESNIVPIAIPEVLPSPRINATLHFTLMIDGSVRSENEYDIVIAERSWVDAGNSHRVALLSLDHAKPGRPLPGHVRTVRSLKETRPHEVAVICNAEGLLADSALRDQVIEFVREGGRLLLLGAASQLPALFPGQVKAYRPCGGEIVTMRIPESPVFDGIEPMDLCWFELGNGMVPRACTGTYQVDHGRPDANPLAEVVDIHGYLKEPSDFLKISGSPLIELTLGSGRVLATEMTLLEAPEDPIAGRLLGNLIRTLGMP